MFSVIAYVLAIHHPPVFGKQPQETFMKIRYRKLGAALAVVAASAATLLSGCGGGGGAATTDDVAITVVDGAIENALVCLDKNRNGACDGDEPSGKTNAAGQVTLKVDKADTGKFPVLAIAGTDARDADTGLVPVAFSLTAPADKTAIVSPLTTLVQTVIEGSGLSSAAAEVQVKAQAGVTWSLFEDFTKGSSSDQLAAGALARLIVVTTQQQTTALVSTIGTDAVDGSKITREKLDNVIRKRLMERVPALAAAVPAVLAAATPVAREAAVAAQATTLVTTNELPPDAIATVVAINNQVPTGTTKTALEHAQSFIGLFSASMATSWPATSGLGNAFVDACYLDNGNTKASSKAIFDLDPADSIASNQYQVGSTRTNITLLADRTVTNADGSTRREIDVNYQVNYVDGTVAVDPTSVTTLISGSSSGTIMQPGVACANPQNGSNWRFLGNRRIVDVQMRPWNYREKIYSLATGAPLPQAATSSPVVYSKTVQILTRDRNNYATYSVVTGPGLPGVGVKMVSTRLLRDDPLFAGKNGNFVDWKLYDSFRFCRTSTSSIAADVADCVGFGASGQHFGTFATTAALADSGFDALGFVAGGTYTFKVYNDDGWKTVNGQSSQTPIATYTSTLRTLPYSAVTLAGAGEDSDLYPRLTSSTLTAAEFATAIRTKAAFTTDATFTALGALPGASKFGYGDVFTYVQGKASSNSSFWPASRQNLRVVYPAAGALSVTNFNSPAPNSVLLTPTFGEFGIDLSNRQRAWIGSYYNYQ